MDFLRSLKKNKELIWFLAKDDIKKRYAGSSLGIVWAFAQPLVTITIYWFVFQIGLRSVAPGQYGDMPFLVWIMCGLIPWFFFSDGINSVTSVFLEYSYLVKKVVFDINILPVIKIISAMFVHIFFIFLIFIVMALFGYMPSTCYIQAFYYSFCMICLILAIGYFTSSLSVFFRDLPQFVQVCLSAGMWLTPIMWAFDMLQGYWFSFIFKLNPMFYVVEGYRSAILGHQWGFLNWKLTIYFWCVVVLLTLIGRNVFKKMKPHFADVL
ncbi:ABC transporter permease [Holdemanella biformis]|uniref:ABC transporter permease n=1 Tax=Holdemanella biformis TaxID=1735 RepID=UPI00307E0C6C